MNIRLFLKRRRKLREHKDGSVNIRASILALGVGESLRIDHPIKVTSLRSIVYQAGRDYGRKYEVRALDGQPAEIKRVI